MKKGDLITIDIFAKSPPMFLDKDNSSGKGYITCEVKVDENESWSGVVVSISSNGKYIIRLTEKLS